MSESNRNANADADAYTAARRALLAEEKALTAARDRCTALRQALPARRLDDWARFAFLDSQVSWSCFFAVAIRLLLFGPSHEKTNLILFALLRFFLSSIFRQRKLFHWLVNLK